MVGTRHRTPRHPIDRYRVINWDRCEPSYNIDDDGNIDRRHPAHGNARFGKHRQQAASRVTDEHTTIIAR
jgi:hypothetical protein